MSKLSTVIRHAMIENGKNPSAVNLSKIIGCTSQAAGKKLAGKTPFKDYELAIILNKLNIPDDVFVNALKEV